MPKAGTIAIICLCVVLVGVIGGGLYYINKLQVSIDRLTTQQMALGNGISKVASQLVSKGELERLGNSLGLDISLIKDDLKKVDGKLISVGSIVAKLQGQNGTNLPSSGTTPHDPPSQPPVGECALCDLYGYTKDIQNFDLVFGGKLNYGLVSFDASKKNPWSIKTEPISTQTLFALSQNKDESFTLYHKTILERTDKQGEPLEFSTESQFYSIKRPAKQWHWWAPHLDLALDNNFRFQSDPYRFGVSLGWTPFAYGRTINDNSWRLLRIGVGVDSNYTPNVSVHPVLYNIGEILPLLSDAWLSVGLTYNLNFGIVLSLGTTL